jgi:hypothetical protein
MIWFIDLKLFPLLNSFYFCDMNNYSMAYTLFMMIGVDYLSLQLKSFNCTLSIGNIYEMDRKL